MYPVSQKHIATKLKARITEYKTLKNTGVAKRKQPSYLKKCTSLNVDMEKLFDVFCESRAKRDKLRENYGEPMKDDFVFLESRTFYRQDMKLGAVAY